jgi:flagellar hook-associated protein 3 FlgL
MAISTGNLMRVSTSLRTFLTLAQLRSNSQRVFREEQRISTQQQLLSISDDPIAAEKIDRLLRMLAGQQQTGANLHVADDHLSAADSALTEISDLLIQAAGVASEQAGNLHNAEERAAQATVIDGIINQLVNVSNRRFQNEYLFGGLEVDTPPIDLSAGVITFAGDLGERRTLVDTGTTDSFTVTAADILGLRRSLTGGYADFNSVQLNPDARLSELDGAVGAGIRSGSVSLTEAGAGITFQVELSGVETIAGLIAKFNDAASAAGSSLTLAINPADGTALQIASALGNGFTVAEVSNGTTAADLGIRGFAAAGSALNGSNLNRRVTLTTRLADLKPGGVSLPNGVTITNGSRSGTVTFAGATTVQDVLNQLNGSNLGIRAAINDAADGIVIENRIAGSALVIGENGGTDAETLGLRTLDTGVSLSRLNHGLGIHPIAGRNDLRITDAGGVTCEVDLDNARTVGDVIEAIESAATAAGASITAGTSQGGAGLRLAGPGGGMITVEAVGLSPVAAELGIARTGTVAGVLEGDNVGQFYQTGVLSALCRLRDALRNDAASEITAAGTEINEWQRHVAGEAGRVGARSKAMQDRLAQTEDATTATTKMLSELRDLDFTEAVTKFQQAQTALQASLQMASQSMNLSLFDFLQ